MFSYMQTDMMPLLVQNDPKKVLPKKMYNLLSRLSLIYNLYPYLSSLPLKPDPRVFRRAHPLLVPIKSLIFICRCLQETMYCISKMFSM